jgi:hypothetical protein
MYTKIAYEDAQAAAIQLTQCAANLLSVKLSFILMQNFSLRIILGGQWTITTANKYFRIRFFECISITR